MKKTKNLCIIISALLLTSCSGVAPNNTNPIAPTPNVAVTTSVNTTVLPSSTSSPSTAATTVPTSSAVSNSNTIPDSNTYTGYLISREKHEKLSDVTVELNGQKTKTDANGKFVFYNISNGKFKIIFTKPNQYNDIRDLEITPYLKSSDYVLSFNPIPIPSNVIPGGVISSSSPIATSSPTSSTITNNKPVEISGFLRDSVTTKEIVNATVKIGSATTTTDYTGYYNLKVMPGQYTMIIQKTGYNLNSKEYNFQTNKIFTSYLDPITTSTNVNTDIYNKTDLTGIWKIVYKSDSSSISETRIIAFKNIPDTRLISGSEILPEDEYDAINNGKIKNSYFSEDYTYFLKGLIYDNDDIKLYYQYYTYPSTKIGQFAGLYTFTRKDKNTITGTILKVVDDTPSVFTVEGTRLNATVTTYSPTNKTEKFTANSLNNSKIN